MIPVIQNKLKIIVGIPGLIIISILVLSAYSICSVVQDAKKLTRDTEYCIQFSGGDRTDYTPAKTLLDLSVHRMQGSKYGQHHAILVLRKNPLMLYHWSYWHSEFQLGTFNQISGNLPAIYCHPQQYFVNNLPFVKPYPDQNKNFYVRFGQQEFSIPKAYHPRANGGQNPSFSIFVSPNFESLGRTAKIYEQIYIQFGKKEVSFMKKFMESISQGKQLKELTAENQSIKPMIRNGKVDSEWMYYTVNDTNEFTTLIGCYSKSCQHRFIYNDMHIHFYHSPQRLPQWKQMQKDLKNLLDSFAIESNK